MSNRPEENERMLPFNQTPAVDPEEFRSAFMLYVNAAARRVLVPNPEKQTFELEEEDGSFQTYRLTDNPVSRGLTAISSRFRDDPQKYYAVAHRIYALTGLIGSKVLGEWCKKTCGGYDVHDAVIDAAATVKLSKNGKFPRDKFLREVERIAKEEYQDE